jgi:pSer/pThr/pTyr-binding forkhead associated (FHA) protein
MAPTRSLTPSQTPSVPPPPTSRKPVTSGNALAPPATLLTPSGPIRLDTVGVLTIGRDSSCDIVLDDLLVSRLHAFLLVYSDRITLEDLPSRNGIYVNGSRLEHSVRLHSGDRIVFGTTEVSVFVG